MTFWHYGRGEKQTKHTSLIKDTHFSECTVLTEEFSTVRKHFLFHCQSDEKVALPEKKKKQKKKNTVARGTDVSLVISLSVGPVDAAQTPLGYTETSGKNCQWD